MDRWGLLIACMLAASTAQADEPPLGDTKTAQPITDAQRAEAERLVIEGTAAYQDGDYARAATILERAHATVPSPRLLFNIARAWEKAGDRERAIEFYVRYLKAGDSEGDLVRRAGEALDVLRGQRPATPPAATPSPPAPPPPREDATTAGGVPWRTIGVVSLAAGATLLVSALIADAAVIDAQLDDFEEAKRRGDGSAKEAQSDVETAQAVTLVGYTAGGVLALAGLGLLLFAPTSKPQPAVRAGAASVWWQGHAAGARWTGRW